MNPGDPVDECLIDGMGEVIDRVTTIVDNPKLDPSVEQLDDFGEVWTPAGYIPVVSCGRSGRDESIGVEVTAGGEVDQLIQAVATADNLEPEIRTISSTTYEGGTQETLCVTYPSDPFFRYCESRWGNGEVTVGAYVWGLRDTDELAEALAEGLRTELSTIIALVESAG